jgi:hypothetical protein
MADLASAEIIHFPVRAVAPSAGQTARPEPTAAEIRLKDALIGLNNAVIAQRVAIEGWRAALGDLRKVTGQLGSSLRGYHDSLGDLNTRVAQLRTEAVKLEAWADGAVAPKE